MKKILLFIASFLVLSWGQTIKAQAFTFTPEQKTYSENFDGMGATGTQLLTGWSAIRSAGTGTIGAVLTMAVTDGSANSGNVYNVGTTATEERALGTLASASTIPRFGTSFTNNTGSAILQVSLSGVMEQWRSGSSNTVNEICSFEYSTDATDLMTGTWTAVTNFDLVEKITSSTTAAALDGNLPDNQTAIAATLVGLNWAEGASLWIRWSDMNDGGSDGLYCIDDLSITVSDLATANITVNSPSSGNQWRQGTSHTITWMATSTSANVKIEFSDNASTNAIYTELVASVPAGDGTWTWDIPAGQAVSSDCKIRITDIPETAIGSSALFSIAPSPTLVSTLAELRAGTPGTVYTYTGQGIVTFQQPDFRNQKYIQDASAAILIDDVAGKITSSYSPGDAISNITGTVSLFQDMLQFTPESDPGEAVSNGNVIIPEVVTLTQLNSNWEDYEAELIQVENLTFTGATGNFATGTLYPVADMEAVTGNFRTSFYSADYIETPVPTALVNLVVLPNSVAAGNCLTCRNLADFIVLVSTLTVTSPNGGEVYEQGSTKTITWASNLFTDNVKIELTGSNSSVLEATVANTGSYTWNIPASAPIATDYKVRISDASDGEPMDESDNSFSITKPFVAPEIVITEIMYNSPGDDEEWIEVYNNGTSPVDLSGYYILDADPAHIPDPMVIPSGSLVAPGAYFSIETSTFGFFPFVPDCNVLGSTTAGKFSFGNTSDQVKLYHSTGQLIDSVQYSDASPWPTAADGGGATLSLCDPSQDNSLAANWTASTESYTTLQGATILATPASGCDFTAVEPKSQTGIRVFPNPASDYLYISNPANELLEITVLSSIGKPVKSLKPNNQGVITVHLTDLPNGIYIVKMLNKTSNSTQVNKVVLR